MDADARSNVDPITVSSETSVYGAARLMTERDIQRVLVREGGAVAGALTYEDLTRSLRRRPADRTVSALIAHDPIDSTPDPVLPDMETSVGVQDAPSRPLDPDVLLSSQYRDRVRRRAEYDPERRLMVAVLEHGVNDYLKSLNAREAKSLELWREVKAWVEDRDTRWLFSFESICNVLDLDSDYLRRGLHAAKEACDRAKRSA